MPAWPVKFLTVLNVVLCWSWHMLGTITLLLPAFLWHSTFKRSKISRCVCRQNSVCICYLVLVLFLRLHAAGKLNKIGIGIWICSNKHVCSLSCPKTVDYDKIFELSEDVENYTKDFTELSWLVFTMVKLPVIEELCTLECRFYVLPSCIFPVW